MSLANEIHSIADAKPGDDGCSFFPKGRLPAVSPGHHLNVPFVFQQLRGGKPMPCFDAADDPGALL